MAQKRLCLLHGLFEHIFGLDQNGLDKSCSHVTNYMVVIGDTIKYIGPYPVGASDEPYLLCLPIRKRRRHSVTSVRQFLQQRSWCRSLLQRRQILASIASKQRGLPNLLLHSLSEHKPKYLNMQGRTGEWALGWKLVLR